MTDQEINEAVARRLGWTFCEHAGARGAVRPNPIKAHFHEAIPDYCCSIAAAWEVQEKIPYFQLTRKNEVWVVWTFHLDHWVELASASNAPMAICLAFLKVP